MNETEVPDDFPTPQKIVFLLLIFSPLVYLIVILLLQQNANPELIDGEELASLQQLVMMLVITAILVNVVLYVFYIPKVVPRITGGGDKFTAFLMILAIGPSATSIFGLIIGVMQIESGILNLPLVSLFFVAGLVHGVFLYIFKRKSIYDSNAGTEVST